jgi:dihydroxyacid dehydratase/phosphogluconate dehydratase
MEDVHKVGGTPAVLKYLNSRGYINSDCLTVTCECALAPVHANSVMEAVLGT